MSGPIRLVLVGAGAMGRAWIGAIERSADAELVGLVDLDLDIARSAADQTGIRVEIGTDVVEVARRTGADGVVNVTVPAAHLPVGLAALGAGLPVLCEKPVTPTVREAMVLAAAAEASGRLFMVSQSRRYYAALDALRDAANDLGDVGLITTQFMKAPHFGGFREEMDQPLLVDMAIHAFDVARFLLGTRPVRVDCRSFNPAWSWFGGDAAATAHFEFEGGARYDYVGSWVATGLETSWNGSWRLGAAEGTATWDGETQVVSQRGDDPAEVLEVVPGTAESIDGSLAEFVGSLRSGSIPSGAIRENIFTLAMVEAAVRSSETGALVDILELIDDARAEALAGDLRPDLRPVLEGWAPLAERLAPTHGAA